MSINWEPEEKTHRSTAGSIVLTFVNLGVSMVDFSVGMLCMSEHHPCFAGIFFALGLFASLSAQTEGSR